MIAREDYKYIRPIEQILMLRELNQELQSMIDTRSGSREQAEKMAKKIGLVNRLIPSYIFSIDGGGFFGGNPDDDDRIDYAKKLRDENTEQIHKMMKDFTNLISGVSRG
jgi:hypothetical protein